MNKAETKLMIQEYAKNPINNYKMDNADIEQHEGNFICGDDITIYLKLNKDKDIITIKDYSFDGNCSSVTIAAASFLAELIINKPIQEILTRNYETLQEQGFIVSNRRKNAATIALLASINAIYKHIGENKKLDFDDLI